MKSRLRRRSRGQALAELALVLPVMLSLFAGAIDLARAHQSLVVLQSATRNGVEYVARYATDSAGALIDARRIVCRETAGLPDAVAGGNPDACSSPTVSVTSFSRSSTAPGASTSSPLATVTISSSLTFHTVLPYPFIAGDGTWTMTAVETFSVLQK
jgi:Flp pilus assembly protein TadG